MAFKRLLVKAVSWNKLRIQTQRPRKYEREFFQIFWRNYVHSTFEWPSNDLWKKPLGRANYGFRLRDLENMSMNFFRFSGGTIYIWPSNDLDPDVMDPDVMKVNRHSNHNQREKMLRKPYMTQLFQSKFFLGIDVIFRILLFKALIRLNLRPDISKSIHRIFSFPWQILIRMSRITTYHNFRHFYEEPFPVRFVRGPLTSNYASNTDRYVV